ncbi:TauD/TfdA dioxygenase family protein [Burkholderia lata]|uniref:TauD/TfdA dioxygenase family protein n=1 Tax=Burkholderia lata (strain ATCC 17760 / DSM 23089 / LMG 22485 / NCIMB 9086 / R18194 / 383) TaxID=482957 RepID=UPI0014544183|nr:TauD/TfdA family dioxygenase [Burkholderia lata]VWC21310.1 taurine dioxygenase [Burkholderia lata]
MHIEHLTPCIGSEITDIDLADPQQIHKHAPALRALLAERQVIFFRDQELSAAAQVRVATVFGRTEPVSSTFPAHPDDPHVELLISQGARTGTDIWHADLTWQAQPPAGACLYAVDVPETGGDTMWSSMTTAFASLDADLQKYLQKLKAIHNWEAPALRDNLARRDPSGELYKSARQKHVPIEQPVILEHPVTGKPVVFVNALYTTHIQGVTSDESTSLIALLSGLAKVPEWQVRFRWRKGSVAVWDNIATQHYAVNDYHPAARRMHRVAIRRA